MEEIKEENTDKANLRIFDQEVDAPHETKDGENEEKKSREEIKAERRARRAEQRIHYHSHHHSGSGIFGLLILFSGVIFLLNNFGLVSWNFWNTIKPFWPILAILVGIKIILGSNWFSRTIVFILALLAFVSIIGYGLIRVASPLANFIQIPPAVVNFLNQSI